MRMLSQPMYCETWFLMFASSAAGAPRKNLART